MFAQCLTLSVYTLVALIFEVSCFLAQFIIGSRVQSAAEKLDSELSRALTEVQRLRSVEDSTRVKELAARKKEHQAFESRASALARVRHLEKVHKKVQLKEFHLIK